MKTSILFALMLCFSGCASLHQVSADLEAYGDQQAACFHSCYDKNP